jgi:hypothetical protein
MRSYPCLAGGTELPEKIKAERARVASEIAEVENRLAALQTELATGHITRQRAECISAHSNEELRRLTLRLADLDASISLKQDAPKTARSR